MSSLKSNLYFKIGSIIIIIILLLIPTVSIQNLITERETTQEEAIAEVSSKWGEEQTISGPIITIPYYKFVKEQNNREAERIIKVKDYIHILPNQLNIKGEILPEQRNRGIYEIVVYNSKIELSGSFDNLQLSNFDIDKANLLLDEAHITCGIDDLRGIEQQIKLTWNNKEYSFNPGVISNDVVKSGINAPIQVTVDDSMKYDFSFNINLKGSQKLYFTPLGKTTDVNIHSSWKNPSFNGSFLPDSRTTSDTGFTANWNILHLNRNFPQMWLNSEYSINPSAFGIDLLLPVDSYQKTYRSIKYAILFIVFTFLTFFFIEILNKIFIHPIQYILVGIALIVFYTLLLSISEHVKFNLSFIISALSTLLLIAGYIKAILKSSKLTYLISSILVILYSFIFVIIQLQDYSLLIGSIGIFIILGLVMYFSRQIDWYNIVPKDKNEGE